MLRSGHDNDRIVVQQLGLELGPQTPAGLRADDKIHVASAKPRNKSLHRTFAHRRRDAGIQLAQIGDESGNKNRGRRGKYTQGYAGDPSVTDVPELVFDVGQASQYVMRMAHQTLAMFGWLHAAGRSGE